MEMAEWVDPAFYFILLGPPTFSTKIADVEFEVMRTELNSIVSRDTGRAIALNVLVINPTPAPQRLICLSIPRA